LGDHGSNIQGQLSCNPLYIINPVGWHEWSADFALSTLYYAEYNNTGPGSDTTNRVTWPEYLVINNAIDATNFTVSNFLGMDRVD